MELEFLKILANYGPLGLWTAYLLWTTHRINKERQQDEKDAKDALQYHQKYIVIEQEHLLERALEKLNEGLAELRLQSRK